MATVNVTPGRRQPDRLAQPVAATFGRGSQAIHLTGFEVDALTGEQLKFRLAWESEQTPGTDYTVFTQLLDQNGQLAASFDRPPLDGAYPSSTWLPGQTIIDPRYLPLTDVPPGDYDLIVGLYDPATGERLPTAGGADFVKLSQIAIEPQEKVDP